MNEKSADKNLELGKYDESELIELVDADVHGGTGWSCAIVTLASAIGCPTTSCTDSC